MSNFSLGEFVTSCCGRDKGNIYAVQKVDDVYVYLVDGKGKKIESPKKKKQKHIQTTNKISNELNAKWTAGEKILDAHVRKQIKLNFL